jgi:hypothetical protein
VPSALHPDDHEALFQEALLQEALLQEALLQEALFQDALFQDALFQEAFARAALDQLAASKTRPPFESVTTYALRPAFGLGGVLTAAAAVAWTSPTPRAYVPVPGPGWAAVNMSAPLTSSGVHVGCRARRSAAIPETTGAEKEVPDIHM